MLRRSIECCLIVPPPKSVVVSVHRASVCLYGYAGPNTTEGARHGVSLSLSTMSYSFAFLITIINHFDRSTITYISSVPSQHHFYCTVWYLSLMTFAKPMLADSS
jgi:hypothetical protein